MDLNAVRMFVAAVQAGSLSAAAARLEMALPTLSRHIRELEGDLKVRLFERGARGVRLTDAGTRLYEHAVRAVESLEDAERALPSATLHDASAFHRSRAAPSAVEPLK